MTATKIKSELKTVHSFREFPSVISRMQKIANRRSNGNLSKEIADAIEAHIRKHESNRNK